ncbi:uncharacterized protein [Epargyreus clarus]|uniref:uncharacterized protein n=1 Tax=Epargyreus clarus TaxID=520877 RepID=UPI003C2B02F6
MVVQEEDEAPAEAMTSKRSKYVVVKNHVREILPENQDSETLDDNEVAEKSKVKNKKLKKKRKSQQALEPNSEDPCISKTDLDDLKHMYNKCKALLLKMEDKYGHLLDLEDCSKAKRRKYTTEESGSEDCSCSLVKKIIFDENGQQIEKQCQLENHICPKKKMNNYNINNQYTNLPLKAPTVQVDYDTINVNLPETVTELENVLKDPNINRIHRKMVIDKIYLIRQEYMNEIRYERDSIIKQLKENPDELLDFKGTNISSLPGYPTKPIEKSV